MQQQTLAELALMKEVERTNMIMVNPQQQQTVFVPRCDLYTIYIDQRRNCYNCRGFGHIVRNFRNQRIVGQGRRLEYKNSLNNGQSNLNREENLIVLN